ncbi:MAG: hypothetical protein U0746_14900 [Gemmataceae bacterium]
MSSTLRTGFAAALAVAALVVAGIIGVAATRSPKAVSSANPSTVAQVTDAIPPYRSPSQAPLPTPPAEVEDTSPLTEAWLSPTQTIVAPPVTPGVSALPPVSRRSESPFKPIAPKTSGGSSDNHIEAKSESRTPLEPGKLVYGDYRKQSIEGFNVYVSQTTFEESEKAGGKPLEVLQQELADVCKVSPARLLKALRTIKIFVEWDHVEPEVPGVLAVFYGGRGEFLLLTGVLPQKAGHITVFSMKKIAEEKDLPGDRKKRVVLLHELAHAVHYYALGMDNPFIQNAYDQAMARGLYRDVENLMGKRGRAYAAKNEHEYFAELSSAYLDHCGYYPFDRQQLKEYDSVGYALMRQVWGDPERIGPRRTAKGR